MKFAAAMFLAGMTLIIISGCSNEEESLDFSDENARIRRPIKKPPQDMKIREVSEISRHETAPENKNLNVTESSEKRKPIKTGVDTGKKKTGFYTTKKGDSLLSIAAKDEIYGDPLKWTILYRYNRESLSGIFGKGDLPDMELPENIPLKIITTGEFKENLQNKSRSYVVINVLSSRQMEKIAPYAIRIIDNNYPVYLTRLEIEGEEWLRLRVGFFDTREDAEKVNKRIKTLIDIPDIWVTTVGDIEFGEFGGY
jgi:hypothetical protein